LREPAFIEPFFEPFIEPLREPAFIEPFFEPYFRGRPALRRTLTTMTG
jgi:hypothetical protein